MKPTSRLRSFLFLAGSSLMAISSASAITYYWDSNNGTAGFGTGFCFVVRACAAVGRYCIAPLFALYSTIRILNPYLPGKAPADAAAGKDGKAPAKSAAPAKDAKKK